MVLLFSILTNISSRMAVLYIIFVWGWMKPLLCLTCVVNSSDIVKCRRKQFWFTGIEWVWSSQLSSLKVYSKWILNKFVFLTLKHTSNLISCVVYVVHNVRNSKQKAWTFDEHQVFRIFFTVDGKYWVIHFIIVICKTQSYPTFSCCCNKPH